MIAKMPVLFVSHGSPMLALDTDQGRPHLEWAKQLPKATAILVFSAHWETKQLCFGETRQHHDLIYDFHGFPDALYEIQYPAPGSEHLCEKIEACLDIKIPHKARGLDHGVWVPFSHMWPNADIPILQMSLPSDYSNESLFELGKSLSPLRNQGVLICGNGTLTHNLSLWNPNASPKPRDWAVAFDEWCKQTLSNKAHDQLIHWNHQAPQAKTNHPTLEHFKPLLIAAGAADQDETITFPIEGFEHGLFSKRCVQFDS